MPPLTWFKWILPLLITFPVLADSDKLEYWLADSAPFWSWDAKTFFKNAKPLGFRWTTQDRSARAAPLKGKFFGHDAYEVVVRFEEGSPENIMISFYNRGDSTKPLSEGDFKNEVREIMSAITQTLRVQPRPGTQKSRSNQVRDDSRIWQRPEIQFELAYSFTPKSNNSPFRAEFIRLTAKEFTSAEIPSHAIDRVNPYEIRKNITRNMDKGDVYIDNIPMVDQGPKGYCAAATSERILRFFGQEVDQHQVAQVANTTSGGGTSTTELKKALQAVGRQYGFKLNSHLEWDFKDWLDEMEDYNRMAKRKGQKQVKIPRGGTIYVNEIYKQLDPETYKATRMGNRAEFKKFEQRIKKFVNGGCPLAWSVSLGMFKEETPTSAGGHLRMIIGYNDKTREILYSDSWGKGHALKRMPIDQAYTITKALFSLEPKGLRL